MSDLGRLNKITKRSGQPPNNPSFIIVLSEDAERLAKQSQFGPSHDTAMFNIQSIVAAGLDTSIQPPDGQALEPSSILAWVVKPKFTRLHVGDSFLVVTRPALDFSKQMQTLGEAVSSAPAHGAIQAASRWVKANIREGAAPLVTAYLDGLLVIEIADLAGVLIAVQPDNMGI